MNENEEIENYERIVHLETQVYDISEAYMESQARIAALEAELANCLPQTGTTAEYIEHLQARIAALEDEVEKWIAEVNKWRANAEDWQAEVARLKCCGNCGHYERLPMTVSYRCNEDDREHKTGHSMCPWSDCRFTPSRWAERGE